MCKIFLCYKNSNTKHLLLKFLNFSEISFSRDGYGIGWFKKTMEFI